MPGRVEAKPPADVPLPGSRVRHKPLYMDLSLCLEERRQEVECAEGTNVVIGGGNRRWGAGMVALVGVELRLPMGAGMGWATVRRCTRKEMPVHALLFSLIKGMDQLSYEKKR